MSLVARPDKGIQKVTAADVTTAVRLAHEARNRARAGNHQCFLAIAQAGQSLRLLKETIPFGDWLNWLSANLPEWYQPQFDEAGSKEEKDAVVYAWIRTAQNWMKVAKHLEETPDSALEQPHTIRELFKLAGMLPEGEPTATTIDPPPPAPSEVIARLSRVSKSLRGELDTAKLAKWPQEEKQRLRNELAWLTEILRDLEAA